MDAAQLSELTIFLAVAQYKSFRRAALDRGVGPSAVSHAIRSLEQRLGLRLLHRTTRSVSLTEAGDALRARLEPAFGDIRTALDSLNDYRNEPHGTVRLTVPSSIAPFLMAGVLQPLLSGNPNLKLEVSATDRLVDIVSEGIDAGIRFGERLSQDVVAVRIKPELRFTVVGSPAYFRNHPLPRSPNDLTMHDCIRYAFPSGAIFNWEFRKHDQKVAVSVEGPLTTDSQEVMIEGALSGVGLAFVWDRRSSPYIEEGRLISCLEDWCPPERDLFLYYPSRRHVTAALRALIDLMRA